MRLSCYINPKILIFITLVLNSQHADADQIVNKKIEIKFNDPRVIEVPREGVLQLTVTGIPDLVTYIICQAHTQYHNITLSTIPMIKVGTSVNGSNIGVVLERKQRQSQADCYLTSHHNYTINVLIYFMYLNYNDPLPGGCNLEFNLENDPNIHIQYTTHATTIQFQWGNVGQPQGSSCELPNFQNQLEYEIYVAYLTENDFSERTYFSVVKSLKTIRNNGRTKSQLLIGSYVGQGAIYIVVVKQQDPTGAVTMASYIPMVTYACNLNKSGDCVETELFIGGFMAVFLVSYILLNLFTSLSTADIVLACMWGLLFVSGTTLQLYREKGRPDFPPCPRKVRAQQRLRADNVNRTDCVTNEEEPLLREERHTVYNTNRPTQHQNNHTNVQTQRTFHPSVLEDEKFTLCEEEDLPF
ncbi:hypothetical protein KUTeg_022796, partial [Tegillarca granosa]